METNSSSVFVLYSKVLELFKKKPNLYDEYEISFIKNAILSGYDGSYFYDEGIREIFDELGLLPNKNNIYMAFIDLIKSKCDINGKNILEVGGGTFPRLAKRLSLEQKNGTITVYDPRLDPSIKSTDRLILKKEKFDNETKIGNTDLFLGLMPCKGAEFLLNQALKNDRDFILWLCEGGPHGDYFDYFEDESEWLDSIICHTDRRLEEKGQKIKIKKMEDYSPYPIISNI